MRVIGADGEQVGILGRDEALAMAEEAGLDLVEIQPTAEPPVCRIMDFGKFKFEQQKKANAARKKSKQVEIKEVKFRPTATRSRSTSGSAGARCAIRNWGWSWPAASRTTSSSWVRSTSFRAWKGAR